MRTILSSALLDRAGFDELSDIMRRLAQGAPQAIHLADHLLASKKAEEQA